MNRAAIDMNCDLGEQALDDIVNFETLIYPYITSCNIASGGHAGDKHTIRASIQLAKINNVKIGIHPSHPDRKNFGRSKIEISNKELIDNIAQQITLFLNIASEEQVNIHHIKAHGALYHQLSRDEDLAKRYLGFMNNCNENWIYYAQAQSPFARFLKAMNVKVYEEVFMDRRYDDNLNLIPRTNKAAILNKNEAVQQYFDMINHGQITCNTNKVKPISFQTICIHSDHPEIIEILKTVAMI